MLAELNYTNGRVFIDDDFETTSYTSAVFQKLIHCGICLMLNVFVVPKFPFEDILNPEKGFLEKIFFAHISLTLVRTQYYYAWIMADCINNAAGFGFSGYDDKGNSEWDLISNIDVWKFETADNLKDTLDAWNRGTMYWLRRVAYERTPRKYRTVFTYVVSAWWHGFFTGYYATFLTGALFTEASRMARKRIRTYFQDTNLKRIFYNVLTYVITRIAICYAAATFVLLHWREALQFYSQMYFFMHFAAVTLLFITPRILLTKEDTKSK
uniref:Uncharacterized protein n=1 Tax=Romanomermis culicivorax TaxID=13658 RepID=A0A915IVR6_ROMCU